MTPHLPPVVVIVPPPRSVAIGAELPPDVVTVSSLAVIAPPPLAMMPWA